jgi:RNA polymerase sigma-70 factor (ECF subfamily)
VSGGGTVVISGQDPGKVTDTVKTFGRGRAGGVPAGRPGTAGRPHLRGSADPLQGGALRLTGHEADAQDLVQDTLTRGLERRAQFQPGTNLRAWLFTSQRSLFINAYRRRRHVAWLGSVKDEEQRDAEPALTTTSAEETMLASWVDERLRGALAALPEQYREVVVLRDVAQRSYAQIAAQLDCPPGTVMSRLHRGRALLRQLLEQRWAQASASQVPGPVALPRSNERLAPAYELQAA